MNPFSICLRWVLKCRSFCIRVIRRTRSLPAFPLSWLGKEHFQGLSREVRLFAGCFAWFLSEIVPLNGMLLLFLVPLRPYMLSCLFQSIAGALFSAWTGYISARGVVACLKQKKSRWIFAAFCLSRNQTNNLVRHITGVRRVLVVRVVSLSFGCLSF